MVCILLQKASLHGSGIMTGRTTGTKDIRFLLMFRGEVHRQGTRRIFLNGFEHLLPSHIFLQHK